MNEKGRDYISHSSEQAVGSIKLNGKAVFL
jgi:hypothetical protein